MQAIPSPLPHLKVPHLGGTVAPLGAAAAAADLAGFAWARAAVAGPLILADGSAAAEQQTVVRVAWTAAALWIRFDCADRDAWSTYQERNDPLYLEEVVEVFLAAGGADPHSYWEFEISPRGVLFAARVHNPTRDRAALVADTSWACRGLQWRAAATGESQNWWAALAIPWHLLEADSGAAQPLWRANFYRIERPRDSITEHSCWSPTLTSPADFHRPDRFGFLDLVSAPAQSPA